MTRHFLDVSDAEVIATPLFLLTQQAVSATARRRALGIVFGDPGLGKTFAVGHAVTQLSGKVCYLAARPALRERGLCQRLLFALTGVEHTGSTARLEAEILDELAPGSTVIVDEAQHLTSDCIELLRFFWDQHASQLGLLLVGGHRCFEVLSREPSLMSRVTYKVPFQKLSTQGVIAAIPKYHPIYRSVPSDLIEHVDGAFCDGEWRAWAKFTATAAELCQQADVEVLNQQLSDQTMAMLDGRVIT